MKDILAVMNTKAVYNSKRHGTLERVAPIRDSVVRLPNEETFSDSERVRLAGAISFAVGPAVLSRRPVVANVRVGLLELSFNAANILLAPLFVAFLMVCSFAGLQRRGSS